MHSSATYALTPNRTGDLIPLQAPRSATHITLSPECLGALWNRLRVDQCPGRWPGRVCAGVTIPGYPACPLGHSQVATHLRQPLVFTPGTIQF